jgi:type IV secretion system protein VirD4
VLGPDDEPNIKAFEKLMGELEGNPAGAGLCQEAAALMGRVGDREWGSILSTVQRSLSWAASPVLRESMKRSDFRWEELRRDATVYIVLPFRYMDEHKRWLRILVNQSINTMQRITPKKTGHPVLFVLDEFPSYGHMPKIENSFAQMRGAGIKLWCLIQNIGQLQKLYQKNWETFLANSTVQYFGVKTDDRATADHVSRALGRHTLKRRDGVTLRLVKEQHDLMTPQQVGHFLNKDALHQIVFPVNAPPLKLARINYYDCTELLPPHTYDEPCRR